MKSFSNIIFSFLFIFSLSCQANAAQPETKTPQLVRGGEKIGEIRELTQGKNVALIINQTSGVGENMVHLLDTLLAEKVAVKKVFLTFIRNANC